MRERSVCVVNGVTTLRAIPTRRFMTTPIEFLRGRLLVWGTGMYIFHLNRFKNCFRIGRFYGQLWCRSARKSHSGYGAYGPIASIERVTGNNIRVPTAENRENAQRNSLSGKTRIRMCLPSHICI